jgi:hypothetical protein
VKPYKGVKYLTVSRGGVEVRCWAFAFGASKVQDGLGVPVRTLHGIYYSIKHMHESNKHNRISFKNED